jgi:hypothetical protein
MDVVARVRAVVRARSISESGDVIAIRMLADEVESQRAASERVRALCESASPGESLWPRTVLRALDGEA